MSRLTVTPNPERRATDCFRVRTDQQLVHEALQSLLISILFIRRH
jgi:hypothetical protein